MLQGQAELPGPAAGLVFGLAADSLRGLFAAEPQAGAADLQGAAQAAAPGLSQGVFVEPPGLPAPGSQGLDLPAQRRAAKLPQAAEQALRGFLLRDFVRQSPSALSLCPGLQRPG